MPLKKNSGVPIALAPLHAAAALVPPGAGANNVLAGFTRIPQKGDNLCWAACAGMLFRFRGFNPVPQQCDLAATEFGQAPGTCCVTPIPGLCDQGAFPDNTYTRAGVAFNRVLTDIPFADIQTAIDNNQPVEVYYAWTNGGAHVAMLSGYYTDSGVDEVEVDDPYYSGGRLLYSDVQAAYGFGVWNETYTF